MSQAIFRLCAAFFIIAAVNAPVRSEEPRKPLAAWFAGYETITFNDEIVWPLGLIADVSFGSKPCYPVEPGALHRASAILVGAGSSPAFSPEDVAGLKDWVANGGILILSGAEGPSLLGNPPPAWVGAKAWWTDAIKPGSVQILTPGHPLARGLDAGMVAELTGAGGVESVTSGVSVLGRGPESCLMINSFGKGQVIVLGGKLCPQGWPPCQEGKILMDLPPVTVQVWRNLIATLPLQTTAQAIGQWAQDGGKEVAVWSRWQKGKPMGGISQVPPYPLAGEELQALTYNVGLGERCWKSFFVTNAAPLRGLTVAPTDLSGADGARMPASALTVYIQDKPYPDFVKGCYWLVEPQYVAPLGSPAVTIEAGRTTTWWVKLRCVDAPPGDYVGAIELKDGGRLLRKLPVRVKVWPLRQPGPELLHYEMEHMWYGMPGGTWTSKDPRRNNPPMIANYMEHLGAIGVDFGQSWGDVDKRYCLEFVRVKEDGRLWKEVLQQNPQALKQEKLPRLDFSEYDRIYFDNAIRAGLTGFSMNYLAPDNADLAPEQLRAEQWYWREYATYLKDRGYTDVYTKINDEFGVEWVKEFIKHSQVIRPTGFKTYTTTYNFMQFPRAAARIDPDIDLWQMGALSVPYRGWLKGKNVALDPKDILWGCTASSFWGKHDDCGTVGWLMAYMRFAGFHTHGYKRWLDNDAEGALSGPEGPFDSVTAVLDGQSVLHGRYLASFCRMIEYARKSGKAAAAADQAEKALEGVIGRDPHALIPIIDQEKAPAYGDDATFLGVKPYLPADRLEAAKLRLFELTMQLKAALGDIPADVKYGETYLVRDGRAACFISYSEGPETALALADCLKRLGGAAPDIANGYSPADEQTAVILGVYKGNHLLRTVIAEAVPGEITDFYPSPGRYAIKYLPAYRNGVILILGGNEEGVKKGVEMFARFLTRENGW